MARFFKSFNDNLISFRLMEVTPGCPPVADRKLKPSKMSGIGSSRRRTIEVSATMLRDILIGRQASRTNNSSEDLSSAFPAVTNVSRGDNPSLTPIFVQYPPQKVEPEMPPKSIGGAPEGHSSNVEPCDFRPPPYYVADTMNLSDSFSSGSRGHGACPCCVEDDTPLYDESMYRVLPNLQDTLFYTEDRRHQQLCGQFFTTESSISVPINAVGSQDYTSDLITDQMESLQHKQLLLIHSNLSFEGCHHLAPFFISI